MKFLIGRGEEIDRIPQRYFYFSNNSDGAECCKDFLHDKLVIKIKQSNAILHGKM